jgi:FkbM family methyltransferase
VINPRVAKNHRTSTGKVPGNDPVVPLRVAQTELEGFSKHRPLPLRLAQLWASHGPRARSWLPRKLGRVFGRRWKIVVDTADGDMLAVDPTNLDVYTAIVRDRGHEPWILHTCLRLVRSGDVFYDVGASAGYFSIGVAGRAPGVTVVAFEPQPTLARAIAVSAALNGLNDVLVLPTMLGARDGSAKLFVPSHSVHASAVARAPGARALTCAVTTLDGLVDNRLVPWPTLVKIDVEGAELEVLQGATRLLRENPPYLVLETNENAARFGYSRGDLLDYLRGIANFAFFGIHPNGSLLPLATGLIDAAVSDLLAVPRGRASPPLDG